MRILVTGATGFIGQSFARAMLKDGHDVHLLVRPRNDGPDFSGFTIHTYEGNGEQIRACLRSSRPEVVFHFASLFLADHKFEQIKDLIDSNLLLSTQLVEAMVENECLHLVSAGTAWQNFNDQKGLPTNLYAATKEAFEVILRYYVDARGLNAIVLKLNDTYGPGDPRRKLLAILREAARSGTPLGLSGGEQKIDLLHVSDAVSAFKVAGAKVRGQSGLHEYYLRSGRLLNIKELVEVLSRSTGRKINAIWGERPYRAREVMTPWPHGTVLPDWAPATSLESGLRDYFNEGIPT